MRVGVMQGNLQDFHLAEVLRVVALGRQYTGIDVTLDNGTRGTVFVKSGKVVSVEANEKTGVEALKQLFGFERGSFSVFRSETPAPLPEPLGAVRQLLPALEARSKAAARAVTKPAPAGAPPLAEGAAPRPPSVAPTPGSARQPPPLPQRAPATPAPAVTKSADGAAPRSPAASPRPADGAVARPSVQVAVRSTPSEQERTSARGVAAPERTPAHADSTEVRSPRAASVPASARPDKPFVRPRFPAGHAVVAVASPKGGCGKSTISLNLALSLARRGTRVILIDADVNGDVLSALDARSKAKVGALDVIVRGARLEDALLPTALTKLSIVPAVGTELLAFDALEGDHRAAWGDLLARAAEQADVVLVDTPAGMLGTTRQVLSGASHVLGVLQAESIAQRSFERFHQGLSQLAAEELSVLGVVLNMLQMRQAGSFSVFAEACREQLGQWLFDTTIPRHPAFLEAALAGVPLRPLEEQAPGAVAFLFDNLASEVAERLALPVTKGTQKSLLL